MLRHFYLIVLLLCMEWTFSYNYIDDASGRNFHNYGRHVKKSKKIARNRNRKNLIHEDYSNERIPVEFDVASFIQPDEEAIAEEDSIKNRNKKRRRIASNDYGPLMGMNVEDPNKKKDKNQDYLNVGGNNAPDLNQPLYKDPSNAKQLSVNGIDEVNGKYGHDKYRNLYRDDSAASDQGATHNPGKKSAFKRIKLPFFSHNKSRTLEPKNTKKRKLFCFNCPKKEVTRTPEVNSTRSQDPMLAYKMKRSYEERLCPACKKKFIAVLKPNDRSKKNPAKIIHNSRQFQNTAQTKAKEEIKKRQFSFDDLDEVAESGNRLKRQNDANRERQLKELNEVQKKVDGVPVIIPKFEMIPDIQKKI